MSVKIRLQRQGRSKSPYYHIVVADARAPRDGKFIENIGYYRPQTVPATIELNLDKAVSWLAKGAQPTDTCRAILSYKGALMKHHLNAGIRKGALTAEQADAKFEKWMNEKTEKVSKHVSSQQKSVADRKAEGLAAETKAKEAKAQKIAEKNAAAAAAAMPAEETSEEATDAPAEEPAAETPAE